MRTYTQALATAFLNVRLGDFSGGDRPWHRPHRLPTAADVLARSGRVPYAVACRAVRFSIVEEDAAIGRLINQESPIDRNAPILRQV